MTNKTAMESWLPGAGVTLDHAPDAPRGLYERLQYVAGILREAAALPGSRQLIWRMSSGALRVEPIENTRVVGRRPPSDIIVGDARVSQSHFRVAPTPAGARIEDLKSRNGVYVNGRKIETRELRDGDIVEAGGQVFVFLSGNKLLFSTAGA
ncbi:MAG: FHA domain-containing protein [Lentisphaerae bacterium]|nr:FHA domain-containing protein [Lentisphaerota bacterium]